jgi:hypothetical protein
MNLRNTVKLQIVYVLESHTKACTIFYTVDIFGSNKHIMVISMLKANVLNVLGFCFKSFAFKFC